ncbi:thiamine pyrophosphate-dependent enzyme [Streptomyces sp. MBT62]|uniref:thiamine pyrophosphate-dependent enzyme n=1 Tax=Streptomyces sp. MBT62 TaxID=2800410 RepID=UPI0035ABF937
MRVLTDPAQTGAVVLSLPQDVQSHAYDFPTALFHDTFWRVRRPAADPNEVTQVAALLAEARRPLIIAGGGVNYSGATAELDRLVELAGVPGVETFGGKGAVQRRAWWQLGGIGLEGTPAVNELARESDFVLTVGSRLTDFAIASHSLFQHPDVRFAGINLDVQDAGRLGAVGIVADAKRALAALADEVEARRIAAPADWRQRVEAAHARWVPVRARAIDPGVPFGKSAVPADSDVVTDTDLQKVWDATEGRHCHLEFGFSCMGYELPAAIGVRLAEPRPEARVTAFIGDGTFLMALTELVTAAQERAAVTIVIAENHGYQVIHRLQMGRNGAEFGNEFRCRNGTLDLTDGKPARLESDYLDVDLVSVAAGLGARALRATTADEFAEALDSTRDHQGPVVIVVPVVPLADLPGAGVWWDVAPAEVAEQPTVAALRAEYEAGLAGQRWFG